MKINQKNMKNIIEKIEKMFGKNNSKILSNRRNFSNQIFAEFSIKLGCFTNFFTHFYFH